MDITYYLSGSVVPSNATNQTIYYTSSNSSVVNVGYSSGMVCAGSPGTATITARSAADSSKYATCTVTVNKFKIYQTKNTLTQDENGVLAEDLEYADKTQSELQALNYITWLDFGTNTENNYVTDWRNMCTELFSTAPLENVVSDMVDHFIGGSESNYSNSTLTQKAKEHSSTQTYINAVKMEIDEVLKANSGNITTMYYTAANRNNNPLVQHMSAAWRYMTRYFKLGFSPFLFRSENPVTTHSPFSDVHFL